MKRMIMLKEVGIKLTGPVKVLPSGKWVKSAKPVDVCKSKLA